LFVQVLSGHDVVFKNNKIVASPMDYGDGAPQDCHTYQDMEATSETEIQGGNGGVYC